MTFLLLYVNVSIQNLNASSLLTPVSYSHTPETSKTLEKSGKKQNTHAHKTKQKKH